LKQNRNLLNRIALSADLPGEYSQRVPLIEIAGEGRVLIENHRGVIAYGCNEVRIKVSFGVVSIQGSCLCLNQMTKAQLVIMGKIDQVSLYKGVI
jgi:sporulation protein YqfC